MTVQSAGNLSLRPHPMAQFGHLAIRAVRTALGDPAALVLPIGFPLVILAINVQALSSATHIKAFPTANITDFAIALAFLQGAVFSAVMSATDLAVDVETGFITRIALAPVSAATLLLSRLASVVILALIQIAWFLVAGIVGGASLGTGWEGFPVLVCLVVLVNLAVAGLGFQLALRSGSGEVTQALFPIFFVLLLMSSALMPRNLMEIGWYRTIADINPISYMIESIRSLYIDGWDVSALALGGGITLALAAATILASIAQLRELLARH